VFDPNEMEMHVDPKTNRVIERDSLYIAFYSEFGCSITAHCITLREADALANATAI
jgi:hypothetical protein